MVKFYIICRDSKKGWWWGKSLQKIVSDSTFIRFVGKKHYLTTQTLKNRERLMDLVGSMTDAK